MVSLGITNNTKAPLSRVIMKRVRSVKQGNGVENNKATIIGIMKDYKSIGIMSDFIIIKAENLE